MVKAGSKIDQIFYHEEGCETLADVWKKSFDRSLYLHTFNIKVLNSAKRPKNERSKNLEPLVYLQPCKNMHSSVFRTFGSLLPSWQKGLTNCREIFEKCSLWDPFFSKICQILLKDSIIFPKFQCCLLSNGIILMHQEINLVKLTFKAQILLFLTKRYFRIMRLFQTTIPWNLPLISFLFTDSLNHPFIQISKPLVAKL